MENLTIIIPFYNGHRYINQLLADIPGNIPVIVVDDHSDERLNLSRENTVVIRPEQKGYFTGAVNSAIALTRNDVLILNQDIRLVGTEWMELLTANREKYAFIGERIYGDHPAFPNGYIHGVFQFMRRDAIDAVGLMDAETYPLWGASALWQWQICRKGFSALPLNVIPGLTHYRNFSHNKNYGDSIQQLLQRESSKRNLFLRTPPMISVIVPCYNYGRFLVDCMNSLLGGSTSLGEHPGQSFQSFEIIIVDDGSTDQTPQLSELYLTGWNGVRYIRQENRGMPAALNTGIRNALGRYITILSADDMREPWSLSDLYAACVANPHSIAYDNPTEFSGTVKGQEWQLPEYNFEKLLDKNHVHSGIMFPKSAWEIVGGYSESMRHGREDWQFNVALGRAGFCGVKVPRSGYLYRREEHNRSKRNSGGDWRQFFVMQMREHFPDLYSGVRPMNCCGGSRAPIPAQTRSSTMNALTVSGDDMVLMEFLGTSSGSALWGGPGTVPSGRYYRFGNNTRDKVKYVEAQDIPWFEAYREDGVNFFKRKQSGEILPAMAGMVGASGEIAAVKVQRPVEEQEEIQKSVVISDAPETTEQVDFPDPSHLTVAEIKELDLTEAQWRLLLIAEEEGKFRTGVIDFAESKLK